MNSKTILLEGEVVAKQRPYFSTKGGKRQVFTRSKTESFERYVKLMTMQKFKKPFKNPVKVEIYIKKRPPKSWSKKKKKQAIEGNIAPTAKPDVDNYAKSILDGMNGIAWKDDSYIVDLNITKEYSEEDGATVMISEDESKGTAY